MTRARDLRRAFHHDELKNGAGVILTQYGRPGDCGRDCRGCDLRTTRVFRDAQQDCSATQVHGAGPFIERKDRVRTQARDRQVGEFQFTPRVYTGADSGSITDLVVNRGRMSRGLARKQIHVVDDFRDCRFL